MLLLQIYVAKERMLASIPTIKETDMGNTFRATYRSLLGLKVLGKITNLAGIEISLEGEIRG